MLKILVIGLGYVGTANAVLLSQQNEVTCFDLDISKSKNLINGISPIEDKEVSEYLSSKKLNLKAVNNYPSEIDNFDIAIIATPTNYDIETNKFDTSSIEQSLENIQKSNSNPTVIIRSTLPVGYVKRIQNKFPNLEMLSLDRCKNIKNLKPLNECRKLKKLYIYKCHNAENIQELTENLYWIEIMNYPADLDY